MISSGHLVSFQFPISDGLSVRIEAKSLTDLLMKVNAPNNTKVEMIEDIVADFVFRKVYDFACRSVLSDEFKAILEEDARRRMEEDDYDIQDTSDFVNWCWARNAGHWTDGTPITDD